MHLLATMDSGGSGPPLVLVHGYTGSSDDFRHVVEPLRAGRRVVLVDQLGHGESPRVPQYDYELLTAALTRTLEAFDGPVDLLGHSMGGRTVLPVAIERPDLVRSLILMDTWADHPDRGADGPLFDRIFSLPKEAALAALDEHWAEPSPELDAIVARWGADWVERHHAYNAERVDPVAKYELGRLIFRDQDGVLDRCGRISCPTTVMCGELDEPFVGASQRMADAIAGARLAMIPGAAHSPQLTHVEAWSGIIVQHLRTV